MQFGGVHKSRHVPHKAIPIIDVFAGPGGLSEGFSGLSKLGRGSISFQTCLAIERDSVAAKTLTLRSFFREFDQPKVPEEYYQVIRRELPISALEQFQEWRDAKEKIWNVELGAVGEHELHARISAALKGARDWVLLGGPPCQAYSLMGRARMTGVGAAARRANEDIERIRTHKRTLFDSDHRHQLYREYLRIVAVHQPSVFVMENVKGILSSTLPGRDGSARPRVFEQIRTDLSDPWSALEQDPKLEVLRRYTATPFANIFINPAAYDDRTREDLFPRDFIYCLDAPNNYFGAEKIFLEDDGEAKHIRKIGDAEDILPLKHNKNIALSDLPLSLKRAIQTFVLTRAIRNVRGQTLKHCSMLVNVSRFVDVQKTVRVLIHSYLETLRNAIRANYALPGDISLKDPCIASLKQLFDVEHFNGPEGWEEVRAELDNAVGSMKTLVVNSSKSDEPLDYAAYAARGEALNVIAVGGLSLSRGLTIEGLTVSYMYRNTKMYDTLMQMGRWFGYRPGYEDICRVYLSEESSGWYSHIAVATEELRDRVKEMRRFNKTPRDFGLLVQSHPDALLVTAANKMRFAEKRTVKVSFDGMLRETFVISADPAIHDANRAVFASLFDDLSANFANLRVREGARPECPVWRGINASKVEDFFRKFQFHSHHDGMRAMLQSYLMRIRDQFPDWDIAYITLGTERGTPFTIGDFPMVAQARAAGRDERSNLIRSDAGPGYWISSKQRVAGARDERVGLTPDELARAEAFAKERGKTSAADLDYRNVSVRGRPLLMLHLIDLNDGSSEGTRLVENGPAFGASFPATGDFKQVDYVLNQVMIDQLEKETFDVPDDDEDYDQ
jgi:Z1 domain/C-5 cytosine-specific DNA methylase